VHLGLQFLVNLDAGLHGERSEVGQQQFSNRRVYPSPKNALAVFVFSLFHKLLLAEVFGVEAFAFRDIVVAHRHPVAAASTDDQPLQQRRSFPWRTMTTIFSMGLAIGAQLGEVRLAHEKQPLLLGKRLDMQ